MMKNNIKILAGILTAIIFCSCDHVAEIDRYVELGEVKAQRVVLLEEFTGQDCRNCPNAHQAIKKLHEQYGESLISVSIHAGSTAFDEGENGEYGLVFFKTPEGDSYAKMWNILSYPSGVVNRVSGAVGYGDWPSLIRKEIERPTTLDIDLKATLSNGDIFVNTTLRPSVDLNGKLQLWVLEDSLISVQRDGNNKIPDYVHNHVYRSSVNGVDGSEICLKDNVYQSLSHTIPCRSYWNPVHLSIVAFVYNETGVVQAAQTKLQIEEE